MQLVFVLTPFVYNVEHGVDYTATDYLKNHGHRRYGYQGLESDYFRLLKYLRITHEAYLLN